jgi:hypothetical protein
MDLSEALRRFMTISERRVPTLDEWVAFCAEIALLMRMTVTTIRYSDIEDVEPEASAEARWSSSKTAEAAEELLKVSKMFLKMASYVLRDAASRGNTQ